MKINVDRQRSEGKREVKEEDILLQDLPSVAY